MAVVARAPGKLVIVGEYAVLAGAPALAMAVDRYAHARLAPSPDRHCYLSVAADRCEESRFAVGESSGAAIVDLALERFAGAGPGPFRASLDSSGLFANRRKLGLGSSAAATVAWAGAWAAYAGVPDPALPDLIELHRAWQGGVGSGIDIAASLQGGVIAFRQREEAGPHSVSVVLPDGVRFVVISTGQPAATRGFVERFSTWRAAAPAPSEARLSALGEVAESAVDAAQANDAPRFLEAVTAFGAGLDALGAAFGGEIMTAAHRAVAQAAAGFDLAYKVSGAGGGDIGLALGTDADALDAFAAALPAGCETLAVGVDTQGLVVGHNVA